MERDSHLSTDNRQHILLVTGLSGAGKTTALRVLEDLGWEAIDNFPIRLLNRLIGQRVGPVDSGPVDSGPVDSGPVDSGPVDSGPVDSGPVDGGSVEDNDGSLAIGFDSRTRGFVPQDIIASVKHLTQRRDLLVTTVFLDCASGELERRYNETRRRHPLAHGRPVRIGIQAERELLGPLRRWADVVIDTSDFATNQLQQIIRENFTDNAPHDMEVIVSSFGFARGMPPLADLVFDMRFLDNPHWVEELREQTGLDPAVGAHIRQDPAFATVFAQIRDLLLTLLPRYRAQGKTYVNIAFGCTGGRHRSVFTAAQMDEALRKAGFSPTVIHRNLGSRAADEIERRMA